MSGLHFVGKNEAVFRRIPASQSVVYIVNFIDEMDVNHQQLIIKAGISSAVKQIVIL